MCGRWDVWGGGWCGWGAGWLGGCVGGGPTSVLEQFYPFGPTNGPHNGPPHSLSPGACAFPSNSQNYKEQYTTYGWHCGYVHFDGSVAKRKASWGHWRHKVEVTNQGRRVLVPQTSLGLGQRPAGAPSSPRQFLPADLSRQFLEDHQYTTPR